MKITIILLFVSIFWIKCEANDKNVLKIKTLRQTMISFKRLDFGNNFKQTFDKSLTENNVNSKCRQSLKNLFTTPHEEWVLRMIDSSGHFPSGLMSGITTSLGVYDQCIATEGRLDSVTSFKGKYCFLKVEPSLQTIDLKGSHPKKATFNPISNGICIPSVCSQTELTQLLRNVLIDHPFNITIDHCSDKMDRISLNWPQLMALTWIILSIIAVIIGTICEELASPSSNQDQNDELKGSEKTPNNTVFDFFICFSMKSNAKKIFTISEQNRDRNDFRFLNGIQILSMLWSITTHVLTRFPMDFYDIPSIHATNTIDRQIYHRSLFAQFIYSASLHSQTSFIIGGVISLHTSLKHRKGLKYGHWILLRWLRFAPMLFAMFCCQLVWPLLGSGPIFHDDFIKHNVDPCYNNWLPSILLISNWWPVTEQCCVHTWYMSADFQINLFSYFLIIYYIKNHSKALNLNLILIFIGILLPTTINYINQMTPIHPLDTDYEKHNYTFKTLEFNTYNHFMAYFVGTLLAAIVNNEQQITIPRVARKIIWVIMGTNLVMTPFSNYLLIQTDEIPVNLLTISFTTIKRVHWAISLSWLIIALATFDKNSLLTRFLSAQIFQQLSKLIFSIYLSHMSLIWYMSYMTRHLLVVDHYSMILQTGGVIVLSLFLGFVFHIVFEAPTINLIKMVFLPKPLLKSLKRIHRTESNNKEEKEKLN